MPQFYHIFLKDVQSEVRTRNAAFAFFLFVFNSIILVLFSTSGNRLSEELTSGIFWLIIFFSSSVGMAKSFVSEEERGTSLYLQLVCKATNVFIGKLLYNILLGLVMSAFASLLFQNLVESAHISDFSSFCLSIMIGSVGIAVATTVSAAIISRSHAKGALLPVLSLPLMLPLFFIGVEATTMSIYGSAFGYILPNLAIMGSYCIALSIVSTWLFEFIWKN